ncbi:MAG: 4-(cytidine 5'-diphospho)-2-C-methyl-D-erythritol kinase [Oscillospiraceae bacterium]|nr:4-(cytidine 5'-diphospho)-2-C-methyl-D-erythritol kinase [Oscillospiraceae bacterium]
MPDIQVKAPAKLNLALDVLRKRQDGYHDLRMIMQSVSLYDELSINITQDRRITVRSNLAGLVGGRRNLAGQAAEIFLSRTRRANLGINIHIKKNIPICAGLGGGSSDAAAVLRALKEYFCDPTPHETMMEWALEIGSDVPYCYQGGLCLAEGKGEILIGLGKLPECVFVICCPPVAISTKEAYSSINAHSLCRRPDWHGLEQAIRDGSIKSLARRMFNVFEEFQASKKTALGEIRDVYLQNDAMGAAMSGSGPSMFGLFAKESAAQNAYNQLRREYSATFIGYPV